jgi:hypothetical protein
MVAQSLCTLSLESICIGQGQRKEPPHLIDWPQKGAKSAKENIAFHIDIGT